MSNVYQQLTEQFPVEMERNLNKGGTNLTYIPVSEVINRLNKVLGVDKWSFTIIRCERDASDPDFVVAHVRIEWDGIANDWAKPVVRDGFGGQKIKRTKAGGIVDLGDEFKGAISDALKKAAQTLGVALYLARSEEAIEVESFMDAEVKVAEAIAQVPAEVSAKWDQFAGIAKNLSEEKRKALNEYWNTYSGGQPKPKKETVTEDALDKLIIEATRLAFDGEIIINVE
jgi:hypothetical protein